MENKTVYIINVEAIDGIETFGFTDEADLLNFIWDIEDHVLNMSLAYVENK